MNSTPLDLRLLPTFLAVAEELSFRAAADRLHLTPPAVSAHVKRLERRLHASLFDRTASSVTLTPAGVVLQHHARALLEMADLSVRAVQAAATVSPQ